MYRKLLALLVMAIVAVACGSPAEETAATAAPTTTLTTAPSTTTRVAITTTTLSPTTTTLGVADGFPITVAGAELPDRPERIISMSSTSTEILFAIGAGDQVVAVDSFSNYPPEAPLTDLSAFEPSLEAIAAFEPDLVVIFSDPGDLAAGLQALGIPVISHLAAATLDDAYAQIVELGDATGNAGGAVELIVRMQADIAAAVDEFQAPDSPLTFYHEIDNTLYSATSLTFVGSIYSLFGLENIADEADPDGFGFPQLSAEYIIEADPDLIFFGCAVYCGTSADAISERPGWDNLSAVQNGSMAQLDDDIVSRWGPRLVDFVRLIGESLQALVGTDA